MITIDPLPERMKWMPEETVMLISIKQRTGHQWILLLKKLHNSETEYFFYF